MKKQLYHEALAWWDNVLDGKQRNALKIEAYIRYELTHTTFMNEPMHIILDTLLAGDKTIYQIYKEKIKKYPKATYPPVHRMVEKLDKQGLIEETEKKKVSPRNEKWYKITRAGLAICYMDRYCTASKTKNLLLHIRGFK